MFGLRKMVVALTTAAGVAVMAIPGTAQAIEWDKWGTGGTNCTTKLTSVSAAGTVTSHDQFGSHPTTLLIDSSINEGDYARCNTSGTPAAVKKIQLWNNFTFSGVRISSCTAGFPAGFNCTFTGGNSVVKDASPTTVTNRSHVDADEFNIAVSWQSGLITHYQHNTKVTFTGTNGSTVTTNANIDVAL